MMWESGEEVGYSGRTLLIQSAEFALISSLNHGFLEGNRSDLLQTVVDSAWLFRFAIAATLSACLRNCGTAGNSLKC